MKTIVTLFLFATLLLAENPRVYSALGDVIYNNINAIEKLKVMSIFSYNSDKINEYVNEVKKTKELGFLIESGERDKDKYLYLKKLRELIKINDDYIRDVRINFKGSIKAEDSVLFTKLINSELLDIEAHKEEILQYYLSHSDEVDKSGVIESIFDEDLVLKKKRAKGASIYKQIEATKIKRIKDKYREKQEAIVKSLEEEVIKKKIDIRNNQKRELSNP